MKNNISVAAFYQCYKQPKAFLATVQSYRKFYPSETLSIISDGGGLDYSKAAETFNANYQKLDQTTGDKKALMFDEKDKLLNWLERFYNATLHTKEEFIIFLEDDVLVVNKIVSELNFDINGINTNERIDKKITEVLYKRRKEHYSKKEKASYCYGGCGGSIIKKEFIIKNFSNKNELTSVIEQLSILREGYHSNVFASDYWITILVLYFGGEIGQYKGFCEKWYITFFLRKNIFKNIEVLHQDKTLYNKELSPEEVELLGYNPLA